MQHITIVFGHPVLFDMLQAVLDSANYEISGYALTQDAQPAIRETQPDLVLIEVGLGYLAAGWTVLEQMRADAALRHVPVLVYSVDRQIVEEKTALLRAYGSTALVLPTTVDQIYAAVAAALHRLSAQMAAC